MLSLGPDEHLQLLINIESSLRIAQRHQFFNWVQGPLQQILAHELLICVCSDSNARSLRTELFSYIEFEPAAQHLDEICRPDDGLMVRLMQCWHGVGGMPLLLCPGMPVRANHASLLAELSRHRLRNVAAHGMYDMEGTACTLFCFFGINDDSEARYANWLELIVPHLHAALVRVLVNQRDCPTIPAVQKSLPAEATVLTKLISERELEILRWIEEGKSNHEIGRLLSISPLTVKNHVQNLLKKLKVRNRAQAVSRAINLKLLIPSAARRA